MNDYEVFKKNINNLVNIDLDYYKERQMLRRITSLMKRNGFDNFHDYFNKLKNDKFLLDQFVNYITINVSEFYRNMSQWEILERDILPKMIGDKKQPLHIWSSACSTGEEPYSLAMLLTKYYNINEINILATDIDTNVLEKAKIGIYSERAIKNIPANLLNNYFERVDKSYKIKDEIKKCVKFEKMDLLKDPFPRNIDLLICRNVMIYFTNEAKDLLYKKFYNSLSENGVFFVGSTEQILLPEKYGLKPIKTFFYKKII